MIPWLLVTGDFVKTGGMDRANYALARYLSERGTETHLVTHSVDPDLCRNSKVHVHLVPKPLGSYFLGQLLLGRTGKQFASTLAQRGGRTIVNGGNCYWGDVNWVHYVHAAWQPRSALDLAHRTWLALKRKVDLVRERMALRMARVVIANSNRTRSCLIEYLGLAPERVRTVYLGSGPDLRMVDNAEKVMLREKLRLAPQRPIVTFVGAVGDRRKGFDVLFEAWRRLCAVPRWDASLVVAGGGAELFAWKKRAETKGLTSRMQFLGFREDVPEILRASDVLVSPTRYEAYGLNVHEAICCGLPAFVSADAGVAERYPVELRDLLLPNPESVDDLVRSLLAWRQNPDFWGEPLLSFSRQLRSYTWDDMADAIVAAADLSA
jgi:glycosyltransferase involved in cell wall biosynthesis